MHGPFWSRRCSVAHLCKCLEAASSDMWVQGHVLMRLTVGAGRIVTAGAASRHN